MDGWTPQARDEMLRAFFTGRPVFLFALADMSPTARVLSVAEMSGVRVEGGTVQADPVAIEGVPARAVRAAAIVVGSTLVGIQPVDAQESGRGIVIRWPAGVAGIQ